MKTNTTVTIGIPAYNEAANIKYLLDELFAQDEDNFVLENVIVASDGSDDATVDIVKSYDNSKIILFDNTDRKGQAARQNQIMQYSNSDILVLLNADIKLQDVHFISKLVNKINEGADLVSSNMLGLPPRCFFESIITYCLELRNYSFERFNYGINVYTCHGAARAFSRRLYKVFEFGNSVGEDAHSYLFAKSKGFKYSYAANAICYIRCVSTYKDHVRQSTRNLNGMRNFRERFGEEFVNKEYRIPAKLVIKAGIVYFLKNPIKMIVYSVILVSAYISSYFIKNSNTWVIAKSSKVLTQNE